MTHPLFHAQSSVRRFGGKVEDYQPIHDWLDGTKEMFADFRHRALRHHSHGVFEAERLFGVSIRNSSGALIPTRYIALCRARHKAIYAESGTMPSRQKSTRESTKNPPVRSA